MLLLFGLTNGEGPAWYVCVCKYGIFANSRNSFSFSLNIVNKMC